MQVVWLNDAKNQLRAIVSYGQITFGELVSIRFTTEIYQTVIRLGSFPRLGKVEPLLKDRKKEYRSLVLHRHYKIIYYIDNDIVFIAALWDTRSNPQKLSSKIK